jgi:hypothetical protein
VTQHGHLTSPWRRVISRTKQPPERRPQAEHREVGRADEHAHPEIGRPVIGDVGEEQPMTDDLHQRRAGLRQVAEHRIADQRLRRAGLIPVVSTVTRSGRVEVDEALGLADRQGPQQHLLEERVRRRVGADTKREADHGRHRERWRAQETTRCQSHVLPRRIQPLSRAHTLLSALRRIVKLSSGFVGRAEAPFGFDSRGVW